MKRVLIGIVISLLALASVAKDVSVYRDETGVIFLTDEVCKKAPTAFAGRYVRKDLPVLGLCYQIRDGVVYIQDDDGDGGMMPANKFQPVLSV